MGYKYLIKRDNKGLIAEFKKEYEESDGYTPPSGYELLAPNDEELKQFKEKKGKYKPKKTEKLDVEEQLEYMAKHGFDDWVKEYNKRKLEAKL